MSIATQVRMNDETYEKLKKISLTQQRSLNKQINFILEGFINDYERINGKIEMEDEPEKVDFRRKNIIKKS